MFGFGKKKRRGRALIDALIEARDRVPIQEIEELIALAKQDRGVRGEVLEHLRSSVTDDGDDLWISWFGLVAGELGRESLVEVLAGVGRSEGELADEALIPTLTRGILPVLHDVLREIHLAEETRRRGGLYEALEGALVLGDERVKQRLRVFARERFELERHEADPELAAEPLSLLHHLGEPGVTERIREARALCKRGDSLDSELNDLEQELRGEVDFLDEPRRIVSEDWKATARNLGRHMGWPE